MSALMIQGTCSWAGKSTITTALARLFARRGVDVVPFKAQNMSNNARVVVGGEIGVAQYLQALAAGVEPDVRMNPVLVKPEGDNRSQVIMLGQANLELSRRPWRERPAALWPVIEGALADLLAQHQLVLLEGAGSPAEINLQGSDLANMRAARRAEAPVIVVADIDRGGAFAQLYGTWALLAPPEQRRIKGFILNKFRGDASLLSPGPERLHDLTGVPTLGVMPLLDHGLPDEDGATIPRRAGGTATIAVVRYPTASNLDEFKPIEQVADLRWARSPQDLRNADIVVLPGSKHVAADLAWLKSSNIADVIRTRAARGERVMGICGGMQMLGRGVSDAAGVDGDGEGLGLLPLQTVFQAEKVTRRVETCFAGLPEPWAALSGRPVAGYEIRHGETAAVGPILEALPNGLGYVKGSVCGVYLHGIFEQPEIVEALLGVRPEQTLDHVFDALADAVEEHLDIDTIVQLAGVA